MKVIVANYRYFIAGGPEKYMFKFIEAATKRGLEVIPFSIANPQNVECEYSDYFAKPRANAIMYSDTKKSIGNIIGLVRSTVWNYDAEHRLRKLIRDTKPDVVYILHEINHLSPSIIRAAKREGVRVVHRISDFFMFCAKYDFLCNGNVCEACLYGDYSKAIENRCMKGSFFGTLLRVFAMKLYKKSRVFDMVDQYVCTCNFTRQIMIRGGIAENKIKCIPTFIDSKQIVPCYESEHYFLFLGRMAKQKGTIYAIEAMKYLKETDYILKITGVPSESEEDRELLECITDNGLEDKIVFTGFLQGKELEDLITKSTSIVCPAIWYENMPNTVLEAYAYGKPVIASRIGSLAEIIVENETGLLCEPGDAKSLGEQMLKFVSDSSLTKKLGRGARKRCEMMYSEETHMENLITCLKGDNFK